MLARGGDHVMFMGLNEPFADGDTVAVTLVFEHAGEVAVEIPVDLNRKPTHGGGHGAGHGAGQGQ
jgi:copper(I)-binding protein